MERVRLGYVGCGFMAQKVHLPNFSVIPECDLVALAEVRSQLGKRVQGRFGIPRLYPSHRELIADANVDAIAVSADFAVQAEIARDALAAGKHVFMEKPMAISLEQADRILAAAKQTGARLMVGYMKRYDAGNELAKQYVSEFRSSGELGHITYVRNHGFCGDWIAGLDTPMDRTDEPMPVAEKRGPSWLPPQYLGKYLGYLQQYTHNINLMRWLLDAGDDVSVQAVDLDDDGYTGVVSLRIAGQRAVLESGSVSHYRWDEHTQVYFEHGWVKAWAPPLLLRGVPAEVEVYRAGKTQEFTRPLPSPTWSWSYKREAEFFVRALISGEPFRSSGEDTRTDVRVFEDIYHRYLQQRGTF
ncbi:MAG: Gfo/Idh/MocA family protein [Anaerolineae bacterium]